MLLHTASASPAAPLPAAPTAAASAAGGLTPGATSGTTTAGTGPSAGTSAAGGASASRQRAAASPSQTQQSAAGLAGGTMSNLFVRSRCSNVLRLNGMDLRNRGIHLVRACYMMVQSWPEQQRVVHAAHRCHSPLEQSSSYHTAVHAGCLQACYRTVPEPDSLAMCLLCQTRRVHPISNHACEFAARHSHTQG